MYYALRRFPADAPRYFSADQLEEAARYWHEQCPGMALRVTGGAEGSGEGFGLYSEVRPLLDAVARLYPT